MRVLWFANLMAGYKPHGQCRGGGYNGGGWIGAALNEIKKRDDLTLGFCSVMSGEPFKSEQDGVVYYPIPKPLGSALAKLLEKLRYIAGFSVYEYERRSWVYYTDYYKRVIDDFQPDIIHVWGSEHHYGLVYQVTEKPVILHIQGILNPYLNAFLPPFVSWREYRALSVNMKDWIMKLAYKRIWECNVYREQQIIKGIKYHLGRTAWDECVTYVMNPVARYFHVDEILRDIFYKSGERQIPDRLVIITTISSPLYKGYDLVLKTAKLLKYNLYLDFDWRCYGNIDPITVERQIEIRHDDVNVRLMGVASAEELKTVELGATLYFHSSYIDNSPNSLCEAQILGLPVVSTNVGGIPSLVDDGVDGFLVPANDPYQAAYTVQMLFKDKSMNIEMGKKAKRKAQERHRSERVVEQIMDIYDKVLHKS